MTDRERDDVVRDPVSGRPLHEFVVDPLAVPTVLPTEGDPTYGDRLPEPGVEQASQKPKRGEPLIVFNIDPAVLGDEDALRELVKELNDARRQRFGS